MSDQLSATLPEVTHRLSAAELHRHVPPDWYYQSIRDNIFQRYWHRRRFLEIQKLVEPAEEILDIGSADGVFTDVIRRQSGAKQIVGIDVLEESVAWANRHWKSPQMRFLVADAHDLPFRDTSFDAVFCLEMLEHVFEPRRVIREVQRVLRHKGYAVFLVPSDNLLFRCIWFLWTRMRGKIWDDTHIQSFQRGLLGKIAREEGLNIELEKTFLCGMLYTVKVRKQ